LERTSFLSSILKNLGSLYGDETARHHAVKDRQESVDLFLGIDDLNHDRQVLRQTQEPVGMDTTRVPESNVATQDSCAAEVHFPRLQYNRFMEGNAMKFIFLPEKNPEQDGFPWNLHFLPLFVGSPFFK
jgi:hypothetical protein